MRNLIYHFVFCFFLLLSCEKAKVNVEGRWININNSALEDPFIYEFKKDEVYIINSNGRLLKRKWETYREQLLIEDSLTGHFTRYDLERLGKDSLIFKTAFDNHLLVTESSFSERNKISLSENKLKSNLINKSWELSIEEKNKISKFIIEFADTDNLILFSDQDRNGEYDFSNIINWRLINDYGISFIKTWGFFGSNFFVLDTTSSTISGEVVSTYLDKHIQKYELELMNINSSKREELDHVLNGSWQLQGLNSDDAIPNVIVIQQGPTSKIARCPMNLENKIDGSQVRINNSGELLILNQPKDNSVSALVVKEFESKKIKLRFPNTSDYVYIRTVVNFSEDDFF